MILSIETSGSNCSVCLSDSGNTIALYSAFGRNIHDKLLAEFARRIFEDFEIKADDLSAVAVSIGTGSFSGLRIGVSFAKGLCFGGSPKLIAVPTLTAQAIKHTQYLDLIKKTKIISAIHSHKFLFYYQIFDKDLNSISEIELVEIEKIKSIYTDDMLMVSNKFPIPEIENNILKANLDAESVSLISKNQISFPMSN